jgi:signal transduction histidine kinase
VRRNRASVVVSRPARSPAHELGNQLGIVISYAELLLEELGDNNPNRADIGVIDGASRRLRRSLDGVTSFATAGDEVRVQSQRELAAIKAACQSVLGRIAATDAVAADVREMLKANDAVAALVAPV